MSKPRMKWRLTLAGWPVVWVALSIFGASFVHRVNLLLLVFALMISAVIMSARMGRRQIRSLTIRRSFPLLVPAGRPFSTLIDIQNPNPKRSAIGIAVGEAPFDRSTPLPAEEKLLDIPPAGARSLALVRTLPHRGTFRLGPVRLRSGFPLGLLEWRVDHTPDGDNRVIAHPPVGQMRTLGRQRLGIKGAGEGKPNASMLEGIDEFRGVRDYRAGDPVRLVHWRSTARRDSLVVRELDPAAGRGILLVMYLVPAGKTTPTEVVEKVLSFVSTVVVDVSRDPTLAVTLLVVGKEPTLVRGTVSSVRAASYLRALALAEPTLDPADLESARRLLQETDTRDRRYWIVSLAGITPEGGPAWGPLPARRMLQPVVLNATAGDLDSLWNPPQLPNPVFSPLPDQQSVQNST